MGIDFKSSRGIEDPYFLEVRQGQKERMCPFEGHVHDQG